MKEYVKVYRCGECLYYDYKKHKCVLGASEEGEPTDAFYRDCPQGIHREETTKIKIVKRHRPYYTGKVKVGHDLEDASPTIKDMVNFAKKYSMCEVKDFIEERIFCLSCGTRIDGEYEKLNFCPICGRKIEEEPE